MTPNDLRQILAIALNEYLNRNPEILPGLEANVSSKVELKSFDLEFAEVGTEYSVLHTFNVRYMGTEIVP